MEVGGGTVLGTSAFTGSGTLNWTGGEIGAVLTLPALANFGLSGDSEKTLSGNGQITSGGAGSWSGAGRLRVANQSQLVNNGTFTVSGDAPVFNYTGGQSDFVNNGILLKTAGTNTSFLLENSSMAFNNNGVLSVQSGVFSASGGGAGTNGTFMASFGGRIELAAGDFRFQRQLDVQRSWRARGCWVACSPLVGRAFWPAVARWKWAEAPS